MKQTAISVDDSADALWLEGNFVRQGLEP